MKVSWCLCTYYLWLTGTSNGRWGWLNIHAHRGYTLHGLQCHSVCSFAIFMVFLFKNNNVIDGKQLQSRCRWDLQCMCQLTHGGLLVSAHTHSMTTLSISYSNHGYFINIQLVSCLSSGRLEYAINLVGGELMAGMEWSLVLPLHFQN